ncbi:hypothetical protein LCGC14_1425090 [marine sediment metagenome]|uniref:Portal protein n=1 Tax=marine sediment metagenome TaxID=412755 RepID=A0A0F9KBB7_9ZZZZ
MPEHYGQQAGRTDVNIDTNVDKIHLAEDKFPELNVLLDKKRDAGMVVTNLWRDMWFIAFKYTWGRQLQGIKPREDWNYIILNRIYPLMFSTISKLAKNNPKVLAFPWDIEKEGATEFAEKWAGILQYIWESPYELNMRLKLIYGILDAAIFGYMVGKTHWDSAVTWDGDEGQWIGNVRHTFINPATFWTDPTAETMEEAESCGTKRRVKLEWAQARWKEFAEEIEKQAYTADDPQYIEGQQINYDSQKAGNDGDTYRTNPRLRFNRLVDLILGKAGNYTYKEDMSFVNDQRYVTIEEIYWKDYETEKIKKEDPVPAQVLNDQGVIQTDPNTGMHIDTKTGKEFTDKWPMQVTKEYDKPKFPNGRFVLRVGRTILNPEVKGDFSAQQYKYSRWPFTVMPYHILPHMWQGGNACEMVRNNQDMLNLTVSTLVHRTRLTADPERIMEVNALARDRKGKVRMTKPRGLGKIIIVAKGAIDKIRNMEYASMDPATILLSQMIKQDIDDSMFSQDAARGAGSNKSALQKGSGKMTATEAAKIDVNSHDYTAMQAIFLDGWIDETLTLTGEIIQFNYSEGRTVRIISDNQERNREALTPELLDMRFDVNIVPGSRAAYLKAHELTSNPAPQPMLEETLQVLEIANRKKILAKHQGTQLFAQFIQLAQLLQGIKPEEIEAALQIIPELKPVYDLLIQAGQLQIQPPTPVKGVA